MRGGSFDSPTADPPSSHLSVPKDQVVVCRRSSQTLSPLTAGALGCRSPSYRRTWSVVYLRPSTDGTEHCTTRSMPNVRWICDVTGARTSSTDGAVNLHGLLVDSDSSKSTSAASDETARPGVERSQRVCRSDPDMLKLPPPPTTSNCCSRPSSLDSSRLRRQRSLPPRRDMLVLPVNVIVPTDNLLSATLN